MTKPPGRHARRARGAARKGGGILDTVVDRLNDEPTRRQACRIGVSTVAVEVFVKKAGTAYRADSEGYNIS